MRAEAALNKLTWMLGTFGPMEQDLKKLLEEIDANVEPKEVDDAITRDELTARYYISVNIHLNGFSKNE